MASRKYTFSNRIMFAIVMQDEEICAEFIERLFPGKKVRKIRFTKPDMEIGLPDDELVSRGLSEVLRASAETEKSIINGITAKSVRLDVLFEDSDTLYDIEMQVAGDEELPKRSRYYHSSMGVHALKAGQSYNVLKRSYVIFNFKYDPFDMGESVYEFEMYDRKHKLQLKDEVYTVVINTKCPRSKIPSEIESFCTYVETGEVEVTDEFIRKIDERVETVNKDQEVESIMTLEEDMMMRYRIQYEKGEAAGLERGEKLGLERGAMQKQCEIAKNMKAKQIDVRTITEITGLTSSEIEAL